MKADLLVREAEITVIDFETTGSVPGFPTEPWQIGLVTLRNGNMAADTIYESFLRVDAGRPFNMHAPGRHAVIRDTLAQAPAPHEIWPSLKEKLTGRILCAHNITTEKKILRSMAPMHRFGPWIDTLKVARKAWPDCSSYALEDLIVQFGLKTQLDERFPGREAHDALYDTVASALLLVHLMQQPGWGEITVAELAAL